MDDPSFVEDPLGVREGCEWVTERARHVRLGPLDTALDAILRVPVPVWDTEHHYVGPAERTLRYLLVLDTVNFSFWSPPGWPAAKRGYREVAAALRKVFEAGDDLATAKALRDLTPARLEVLLDGPLPMLEERAAALRELGRHGFDGLVQPTAAGTAQTLAERLDSYRDIALYGGRAVPILSALRSSPPTSTARACELPRSARSHLLRGLQAAADPAAPGALVLTPDLARRVDARSPLAAGEAAEVELRCATVTCVERLRDALAARGRRLRAVEVDWILWEASQDLRGMAPYHRTRTVFY